MEKKSRLKKSAALCSAQSCAQSYAQAPAHKAAHKAKTAAAQRTERKSAQACAQRCAQSKTHKPAHKAHKGAHKEFSITYSMSFPKKRPVAFQWPVFFESGIIIIIIAPQLLPCRARPAVGFGPKLEDINPRTFPDLPIRPRTFDFDQKTSNITTNNSNT